MSIWQWQMPSRSHRKRRKLQHQPAPVHRHQTLPHRHIILCQSPRVIVFLGRFGNISITIVWLSCWASMMSAAAVMCQFWIDEVGDIYCAVWNYMCNVGLFLLAFQNCGLYSVTWNSLCEWHGSFCFIVIETENRWPVSHHHHHRHYHHHRHV